MAGLIAFNAAFASTCTGCAARLAVVAGVAAMRFFFGVCSSAALPAWPPVQCVRSEPQIRRAAAAEENRVVISLRKSKRYAARFNYCPPFARAAGPQDGG